MKKGIAAREEIPAEYRKILETSEDWFFEKHAKTTVYETMRKLRFFLRDGCDLRDRSAIMDYLRAKRRDGRDRTTINGYVKYLNRYLESRGWEKVNYLHETKRSFRVKSYDPDEARRILEGTIGPTIEDMRNHAMVYLVFTTGLRRDELCNLTTGRIRSDRLTVIGKGEKVRDVYLPPETAAVIAEYMRHRNHRESEFVFTTRKGGITNKYMGSLASDISRRTGVKFSWHRARHTYAKTCIRQHVDLETLRQMLGHERLDTTQIYLNVDQAEALEEMRMKKVKFFLRFKSTEPCSIVDGLAGI